MYRRFGFYCCVGFLLFFTSPRLVGPVTYVPLGLPSDPFLVTQHRCNNTSPLASSRRQMRDAVHVPCAEEPDVSGLRRESKAVSKQSQCNCNAFSVAQVANPLYRRLLIGEALERRTASRLATRGTADAAVCATAEAQHGAVPKAGAPAPISPRSNFCEAVDIFGFSSVFARTGLSASILPAFPIFRRRRLKQKGRRVPIGAGY